MANASKAASFFGTVEAPEDNGIDVLPTKKKDGAPPKSRYLLEIVDTEVLYGKDSGTPYVRYQARVVEPENFANRRVFDNIFFSEKALPYAKKALIAMLGEGEVERIAASDAEEAAEQVAEAVDGATFVGRVTIEKGGDDYDDKNRVARYFAADTWGQPDAADSSGGKKRGRKSGSMFE